MTNVSTTHVIEIEAGAGEPASIPLTIGRELDPLTIGAKGLWRIDAAGVLDVHAFVYFDGGSLFMQSADEGRPALVNGVAVATTWTELHAPCRIEIGSARLRFRSVNDPISERAPTSPRSIRPAESSRKMVQDQSTRIAPLDMVPPPVRSTPRSMRPPSSASAPPPERDPNWMMRTAKLGPSLRADMAAPAPEPPRTFALPRGSQAPVPPNTMMLADAPVPVGTAVIPDVPLPPIGPGPNLPMPPPGMPPGMSLPPPYPQGYPPAPPTGAQLGPQPPKAAGLAPYIARFKELSPPQRALVILAPFCLMSAAYLLLFDDPRETPATTAAVDAGAVAVPPAVTPPPVSPPPVASTAAVPGVCPPGFVPYSVPINGMIPCVPIGTPIPSAPEPTPQAPATPVARTLERQAVDFVAIGNYAAAAQVYEQMQQQQPTNRVYAEAARILRAKADAGVP